ncbi:hypothetical protein, conserved [Trypanosoma brucei gambiense DAL972]|uniref:Guanine nucleotide-binding protein subunit beta-like protein n=1 Tax=Trypanosoma brucei gambiense (strain MHOM/CI/86/DAL972) TaxID=679716 RepID=D0AAK9_TRYB9|nr:hypothetical protein, conserved [Trypanosoma brucei gambiense DAL972]CBH18710.1 hypothetical protein, conserved [Trypanosoma brucei gambiense DAL972]|eukprot:XP_011780974.1 hypothetical protein, conserved [Trypanosoma brucei gambiense DAL972]
MEVVGRGRHAVMSIAASSTCPTTFGSLDTVGAVTLWDTRLKQKDYARVEAGPTVAAEGDATELLLAADVHMALVLAGEWITSYDLRRHAKLCSYRHTCELATFLGGTHPQRETTTLVVDEDGAITPFSLLECSPTAHLPACFSGGGQTIDAPSFGSLSNWCCGLGFVKRQQQDVAPLLCAIGMDGGGAIFSSPNRQEGEFNLLGDDWLVPSSGEVINPPLLTTCSFMESYVAIGRANGMYSIATATEDGDSIMEIFASPGHAQNNLSVIGWTGTPRPRLVTCSVCGEVSAWDVLPLLEVEMEESVGDVEEGDPPPLDTSGSVREATGQMASVNCGVVIGGSRLVVGDTMGFVTTCNVA